MNEVNDLCIIVQWVLTQVEICNIWKNPNGILQVFFCNRCSYLFETGSNAGFGCWSFMASKAKRRKLKIGLPNSTEISSSTRLCTGSNWVGVWTWASLWEKKWVQFIRAVILPWIRPSIRYQATVLLAPSSALARETGAAVLLLMAPYGRLISQLTQRVWITMREMRTDSACAPTGRRVN